MNDAEGFIINSKFYISLDIETIDLIIEIIHVSN